MSEKSNLPPLPRPTVKYTTNPADMNEAVAKGMVCNPVYVGVPPYPRIVSDEAWIQAAAESIEEQGIEQFLVNMLYMLRTSMVNAVPDEAIPDDYDGPWPGEDYNAISADEATDPSSPWCHPLEGYIFCSHDDLPMIIIDDEFVCVAEFLMGHIDESPVTDLVSEPILSLVFQNGHTLPLLCPSCGNSLHIDDHNGLLDEINGLTLVDVDWDDDIEELFLDFGKPDWSEDQDTPYLAVHLNSVRALTCPHQNLWSHVEE